MPKLPVRLRKALCGYAILMLLASADVSRADAVDQMPGTAQPFRAALFGEDKR